PSGASGGGQGFNGGQLLNLAVAGCISNDLFREAARGGITLHRVRVVARSDYVGDPAVSTPIEYDVELDGDASEDDLKRLLDRVDSIAEIPNSLRGGTEVRLASATISART
ncbi:MAG: OsmC family protein, partial [Actinomycetota bacterium]